MDVTFRGASIYLQKLCWCWCCFLTIFIIRIFFVVVVMRSFAPPPLILNVFMWIHFCLLWNQRLLSYPHSWFNFGLYFFQPFSTSYLTQILAFNFVFLLTTCMHSFAYRSPLIHLFTCPIHFTHFISRYKIACFIYLSFSSYPFSFAAELMFLPFNKWPILFVHWNLSNKYKIIFWRRFQINERLDIEHHRNIWVLE